MKQYHKNPRQMTKRQNDDLTRWLRELGDLSGIVHDLNSDEIIGGNQRGRIFDIDKCEIVIEHEQEPDEQGTVGLGYVIWEGKRYSYRQVRWTEEQCEQANIVANKAGGNWDWDGLANGFEFDNLLEWGFNEKELLGLDFGDEKPDDSGAQMDRAEELCVRWGVELGQLWQLGEHRLICGDCTDRAVVERVMGGEKAGLVMAAPPYNVGYTGGSTNDRERSDSYDDNMSDVDYTKWLMSLFENGLNYSDDRSALMLWFASTKMRCIMDGFEGAGWIARTLIVWNKSKAHYGALGAQYKHKYELLWYCYKPNKSPRFYGETNETTVWDFDQPRVNELHPTMKPVELYERCVKNHSGVGDQVLELFGGSGTTGVACERLGRKARMIEIDPKYCAVILERMSGMGLSPVLVIKEPAGEHIGADVAGTAQSD